MKCETLNLMHTYLPISHHRKIGLETIRRPIYSIMRQSILILLDWLLCVFPGSTRISEAVVSGVVLVLLRRGKRVEVSLHIALGLGVELCLEGGQLLGHAEETSNFDTKNHPDYICGEKEHKQTWADYMTGSTYQFTDHNKFNVFGLVGQTKPAT